MGSSEHDFKVLYHYAGAETGQGWKVILLAYSPVTTSGILRSEVLLKDIFNLLLIQFSQN